MIIRDSRAAESTHWYTRNGEPMYTVMGKTTGAPRNTTLKDARAEEHTSELQSH